MLTLAAIAASTERIGLGRHRLHDLQRALQHRPPVQGARRDEPRPGRLERRHDQRPDRRRELRPDIAERPERYDAPTRSSRSPTRYGELGADAWVKDPATGTVRRPGEDSGQSTCKATTSPPADRSPSPRPNRANRSSSPPEVVDTDWTRRPLRQRRHRRGVYHRGRPRSTRGGPRGGTSGRRDADEVKFFAGVMPALATTASRARPPRRPGRKPLPGPGPTSGSMLGLTDPTDSTNPSRPTSSPQPRPARRPPLRRALEVANEGWTIRDVLAHGVIDYHPTPVGPALNDSGPPSGMVRSGCLRRFLGLHRRLRGRNRHLRRRSRSASAGTRSLSPRL